MLTKIDKELIKEMGWQDLPPEWQAEQLRMLYATLEIKVGSALEHALTDKQLLEFEKVNAKGDDAATMEWLKKATDYEKIVAKEFAALKHDIKRTAADFKKVASAA